MAGETIAVAEEPCMLFTFADLDGRRKAQNALRQSEERFFKSFRLSPVPAAISRLDDFVLMEVNDAFLVLCGRNEAEVVGKTASELRLWEDAGARRDLEKRLKDNIPIRDENMRMNLSGGGLAECIVSAERAEINDQLCVIWAIQDVTERRRTENELIEAIESVMTDTSGSAGRLSSGWRVAAELPRHNVFSLPQGSHRARGANPVTDLRWMQRQGNERQAEPVQAYDPQPYRLTLRQDRRQPPHRRRDLARERGFTGHREK